MASLLYFTRAPVDPTNVIGPCECGLIRAWEVVTVTPPEETLPPDLFAPLETVTLLLTPTTVVATLCRLVVFEPFPF